MTIGWIRLTIKKEKSVKFHPPNPPPNAVQIQLRDRSQNLRGSRSRLPIGSYSMNVFNSVTASSQDADDRMSHRPRRCKKVDPDSMAMHNQRDRLQEYQQVITP